MSYSWVQLRAMIRKDWNQMKAEKCKTIGEVVWSIAYGALIGYQLDQQIDDEDNNLMGVGYLVLLLCCPIIFQQSSNYIANQMVRDRETRMKESLKIMGLEPWIYSLSFLVQRTIWMILTTFFVCFFIWLLNSEVYSFGLIMQLFLALLLFGTGMLSFTMFAQNFFKDAKLATMVMPFIFFIPTGISMALVLEPILDYPYVNNYVQYLYWFPTFPFTTVMVDLLDTLRVIKYFETSVGGSWVMLFLNVPLWFFLHLYVEAIKPDSYGIAHHPCFCLARCRKRTPPTQEQVAPSEQELQSINAGINSTGKKYENTEADGAAADPEAVQNRRYRSGGTEHSQREDPIQLKSVTMQFGKFKAVDNLSLSIRENEIMALLGHNGAGKTTTIYMLTGMLHMSQGEASLYGRSVQKEIIDVRKEIGLCQQHDVLYDLMSIEEHLLMTMRVRSGKVDLKAEKQQIKDILTRTQLMEHKDKLVKQCSGGMKRKLSLGMALVGETRTIILDEPTSGLDVESREQMWNLIRQLKESRSIIMSTQHIEEADQLADRVCIMSHGRIIGLDTPEEIKRKFGVGYNIYLEAKHQYEDQLDEQQLQNAFNKVREIFDSDELEGVEVSSDSNAKKLIIQCPYAHVNRLAGLINEVERTVEELQIDLELNSLEDAFIRIAESDIKEEQDRIKQEAQKELFMSPEDEEKAMNEYFEFEGKQSICQKIIMISVHRIKLFYRDTAQWVALLIPLGFVTMMSYIFYSFVKVGAKQQDEDETARIVSLMLKIVFGFFLTIGSTFTAGMSAMLPMEERKGGLRHMMHLFGLNSFQYFFGMVLGDLCIVLIPSVVCSFILLILDDIMSRDYVPEFFCLFWAFGCTLNVMSYGFSHVFSNPDTGIKYISMIYSLGFFIGPLVLWAIIAGVAQKDGLISTGYSVLFYTSPLFTFWVSTYNISVRDNEQLESWEIFDHVPGAPTGVGIMVLQIIVVFSLTVLVDYSIRNAYKYKGGHDGDLPPHLDVHQDVHDHESHVEQSRDKPESDPDYYQVRAEDLSKTYPGAKRMAVCKNTFGVKKGEVYGLLGPNGAGKSTTFSMMALQIPITSGDAHLMGHEVTGLPLNKVGKYFGICNQENLIWDSLTVDEALNLVAALKGVDRDRRERFKRVITQNLDLTPFKNVLCKNLSGGNKRKLCAAQAIMLCPRVLFLDEPTTGVDPVSRRSLNRMVKKMKGASVLLTTHRMDEAEQLCDKIAIMINGRFVVFGSPNYLKNEYGHGYTVSVKQTKQAMNDPNRNIMSLMQTIIPQATLVHSEGEQFPEGGVISARNQAEGQENDLSLMRQYETRFKIMGINGQQGGRKEGDEPVEFIALSFAFDKLAQLLDKDVISSFAITRTTMGEVFTDFAKFQINAAAEADDDEEEVEA